MKAKSEKVLYKKFFDMIETCPWCKCEMVVVPIFKDCNHSDEEKYYHFLCSNIYCNSTSNNFSFEDYRNKFKEVSIHPRH